MPGEGLHIRDLKLVLRNPWGGSFSLAVPELDLKPGTVTALHGPSGAGKSTLLEFLALLRPASALGTFDIFGRSLAGDLVKGDLDSLARIRSREIGYVPQTGGLLPFLTAREHAMTNIHMAGLSRDDATIQRFNELSERLQITKDLWKQRTELSGGQRKRVSLLRGLALPRSVLLLDEPTTGLDNDLGDIAIKLIKGICIEESTACLAITHDRDRAQRFGLRSMKISDGVLKSHDVGSVV